LLFLTALPSILPVFSENIKKRRVYRVTGDCGVVMVPDDSHSLGVIHWYGGICSLYLGSAESLTPTTEADTLGKFQTAQAIIKISL